MDEWLTKIKKEKNDQSVPQDSDKNGEEILQRTNTKQGVSSDDLDRRVLEAKKSFVEFLEGLLKSGWVKAWLRIFFYFILFCFVWFVSVSLYNILYALEPKKFYIDIWKSSIEFLKLVFAIIGVLFVVIKLLINGKV